MSSVKRCRRLCKVLVPGKLMENSTNFVLILCVESAPQWREYKDNFTFVMKKVCRYGWFVLWCSTVSVYLNMLAIKPYVWLFGQEREVRG